MTRLLLTICAAGLLALPAMAQTPQAKPTTAASGQDSGTAKKKPAAKAAPAKQRTAKADAGSDPEHARVVELNRRELQRIESQGSR